MVSLLAKSPAEAQITVMIKVEGTDSKQASNNPTSWSNIFFFFFPSDGFLTKRWMILAASEIFKIIVAMISLNDCSYQTVGRCLAVRR